METLFKVHLYISKGLFSQTKNQLCNYSNVHLFSTIWHIFSDFKISNMFNIFWVRNNQTHGANVRQTYEIFYFGMWIKIMSKITRKKKQMKKRESLGRAVEFTWGLVEGPCINFTLQVKPRKILNGEEAVCKLSSQSSVLTWTWHV